MQQFHSPRAHEAKCITLIWRHSGFLTETKGFSRCSALWQYHAVKNGNLNQDPFCPRMYMLYKIARDESFRLTAAAATKETRRRLLLHDVTVRWLYRYYTGTGTTNVRSVRLLVNFNARQTSYCNLLPVFATCFTSCSPTRVAAFSTTVRHTYNSTSKLLQ